MYELNLENRFHRIFSVVSDAYGIDPLRDKVIPRLRSIISYKNHEVKHDERGCPDLISFREYGSEDFWWHILSYNGICRYRDVVQGMTLRIPDYGALITITNDTVLVTSNTDNIVEL